jgi:hypothetical protein
MAQSVLWKDKFHGLSAIKFTSPLIGLGCDTIQYNRSLPTFQKNVMHPSLWMRRKSTKLWVIIKHDIFTLLPYNIKHHVIWVFKASHKQVSYMGGIQLLFLVLCLNSVAWDRERTIPSDHCLSVMLVPTFEDRGVSRSQHLYVHVYLQWSYTFLSYIRLLLESMASMLLIVLVA